MSSAASAPDFNPRRLIRWALFFPAAIVAWIAWQQLVARLLYGGVLRGGLSWVEGTAEAAFILVAALIAPARKRRVTLIALGFFACRDVATVLVAPLAGTMADAMTAIACASIGAAIVWWTTRE